MKTHDDKKIKYPWMFVALLLIAVSAFFGQEVDYGKIRELQQAFESQSAKVLANYIRYPLRRRWPLPAIRDKADFVRHFKEIFDSGFLSRLADSDPVYDWEYVGWHGVTYRTGELRLADDYSICCIEYETKKGKEKWAAMVQKQKRSLPEKYRDFDAPVYEWPTDTGIYRIDRMVDAYRLMIWSKDGKKPLDVFENGEISYDGNMGDFHIDWIDGENVARVQNYGLDGEGLYHFFVYRREDIAENENPDALESDVEKK